MATLQLEDLTVNGTIGGSLDGDKRVDGFIHSLREKERRDSLPFINGVVKQCWSPRWMHELGEINNHFIILVVDGVLVGTGD